VNENTTIKEAERELMNSYRYLNRLVRAGLGVSLEELIRGQKGASDAGNHFNGKPEADQKM
jgi:hypothetical protein